MTPHPSLRLVVARNERFQAAIRAGFSLADARDMAQAEAERVAREVVVHTQRRTEV